MEDQQTTDTTETASELAPAEVDAGQQETQAGPVGDGAAAQEQPAATPAPAFNPDEIGEKIFQRLASWQGRQHKELMEKVDRRLSQLAATGKGDGGKDGKQVFDDPDQWLETRLRERTEREQMHQQEIISKMAEIMDNDPLFTDKTLGMAVIEEIRNNVGKASRTHDPELAAELLVNNALRSVYRKQKTGQNALSGNQPANRGPGVQPTKAPASSPAKPVKISEYARKMAKEWGYKDDDLSKVFYDKAK